MAIKLFIVSLFSFLSMTLHEKVKIINTSDQSFESNQLYLYLDNDLKIVGIGNLSGYTIKSSAHSHIDIFDSIITVIPDKVGLDSISVFKNKKLISTNIFTVRECDFHPMGYLSFVSDSLITVNQILSNPFLVISNPKCSYKFRFVVTNFRLNIIKKNGEDIPPVSTISKI